MGAARAAHNALFAAQAHLARGLVGEGHREDAVHRHAVHLVQPGDAMGQYAGLAGTGTGEHEQVAGFGTDRVALRGVQAVEQVGDIHPAILGHQETPAREL